MTKTDTENILMDAIWEGDWEKSEKGKGFRSTNWYLQGHRDISIKYSLRNTVNIITMVSSEYEIYQNDHLLI